MACMLEVMWQPADIHVCTDIHAISADLSGGGSKRTLTKEQLARIATNRAEALARKRARLEAGTPSDPPGP